MIPARHVIVLGLLSLVFGLAGDPEFGATCFDKGKFLTIRLRVGGEFAPSALDARARVEEAQAGGKELPEFDNKNSLGTEVGRKDERIVTWLHVEAPPKEVTKIDSIRGTLQVLTGGKTKSVRTSDFRSKRSRKLRSAELKPAGVEIRTSIETKNVIRIVATNGTGRVTGLRMEGKRVDYHSQTDPENTNLVAYVKKGKLPKGAAVVVEVTDAAKKRHTFRFEELAATEEGAVLGDKKLLATGVGLTITKAKSHLLRVKAKFDDENELIDVRIADGDRALLCDNVMTLTKTPKSLEVEKAYAELPQSAELVVELREDAEWIEVPFELKDVEIQR